MKKLLLYLIITAISTLPSLYAQTLLRGEVLDSHSGQPVTNANIIIKDTDIGTTTDIDGNFNLETNREFPLTIVIQHIGYTTAEKTALDTRTLRIDLWPETVQLAPVDVSVVRLPAHYDVSSARQSVSASELRTRAIQDFQEITRSISSVVISTEMDGAQTISIRGSNANETPVYLDGIKINDSFTNVADLSVINMEDVDNIEVIKGASTLPYEVGAFGGVVNIYSQVPKNTELLVSNSMDLNNGGNGTTTGRLSYVADHFTISSQLVKRSRLYQTFSEDIESENLFGSAMLNWNLPAGNLRFKVISQESQTLQGEAESFNTNSKNQLYNARYTGEFPWLGKDWQLDYAYRKDSFGVSFWDFSTRNPLYTQEPHGNNSSYRIAKFFRSGATETLVQFAGSTEYYRGPSSSAIPPIFDKTVDLKLDRNDQSVTVVSKYLVESDVPAMNQVVFELGIRYDDVNTTYNWDEIRRYYRTGEEEPYRIDEITDDAFNNHYIVAKRLGFKLAGIIKRFNYTTYASLGNNSRLPTLQDEFLRKITTTPIYQQTGLLKEDVNTMDLGIDFSYQARPGSPITQFDGHINVFDNAYINKLLLRYIQGQPPVAVNSYEAAISGVEVSGKFHLPSKRGIIDFSSMFLNLDEPAVFPGKPSYRHTSGFTLRRGDLTYNANMWWDGRKIYSGDDGLFLEPKHNVDVSVDLQQDWDHFAVNTTLSAKNILTYSETKDELFISDQGYLITYYDTFQLVFNVRVSLK